MYQGFRLNLDKRNEMTIWVFEAAGANIDLSLKSNHQIKFSLFKSPIHNMP